MRAIIIFVIAVLLAGCGGVVAGDTRSNAVAVDGQMKLLRVIDREGGVVCYYSYNPSGLSCLPTNDTFLR